ncbi:hypothetical protein SAMN04487948_102348 [Halogranum amylolyticum]|uniref:Uncharacterized protein n=1 Tax=Halogranum amylolyticum TaxID=660520 RepID=A0A1H8PKC0_9EURY|nr:hypothetical protein [Halogranum amylolyticum]SEO42148.1 hypothetical protein SAMN04487948_102348 [Halogranum amylolyticum]
MSERETYDELAGVLDLFGALTREELRRALVELAYKQGRETDETALSAAVEDAVAEYYLVECAGEAIDGGGDADATFLTVGPVAFPTLPPNAEDLPHILDVERRTVDRETLGEQVHERLLGDAARAVAAEDGERVDHLLDVSYDLEAWAPVDVADARTRLDEALQDKSAERQ